MTKVYREAIEGKLFSILFAHTSQITRIDLIDNLKIINKVRINYCSTFATYLNKMFVIPA